MFFVFFFAYYFFLIVIIKLFIVVRYFNGTVCNNERIYWWSINRLIDGWIDFNIHQLKSTVILFYTSFIKFMPNQIMVKVNRCISINYCEPICKLYYGVIANWFDWYFFKLHKNIQLDVDAGLWDSLKDTFLFSTKNKI